MGPIGTEPGYNATGRARSASTPSRPTAVTGRHLPHAPLQALFTRSKRGFYHDGRFRTLLDVVNHYDSCFKLGLSAQQKSDLVEYLKSR